MYSVLIIISPKVCVSHNAQKTRTFVTLFPLFFFTMFPCVNCEIALSLLYFLCNEMINVNSQRTLYNDN